MIVTTESPKVDFIENQHTVLGIKNTQYYSYPNIDREVDIFSELPNSIFTGNDEMGKTMNLFRKIFYDRMNNFNGSVVMQKFKYTEEEDEQLVRLVLQWSEGNAIIYFSFDKNNVKNFVGYSMNDKVNNEFTSNTKDVNDSNRTEIINQIVNLICKLS